jgi:hypothetical protein
MALMMTFVLVFGLGCESKEPDTDDGGSMPGGPSEPGDDPNQPGDFPSLAGDGPDFSEDFPSEHNLNGLWEDGGREIRITQSGNAVTALYLEPAICDFADGSGGTSETDLDFDGMIDGDKVTGDIIVCRYGFDDGSNGHVPTTFEMTINEDDTEMTGTWYDNVDDRDVPLTVTRLGCLDKSADDYGLPAGNVVNSEYNANRVYRKDGSVQTVPDDYVLNPETDDEVRRHRGVDYSSMDENGTITEVEFTAGVSGVATVVAGSAWNTINVTLPNGNVIQYLHASEIHVTNGQQVSPGTVLGKTGDTGANAIHLHVQAKDANGNYINPSCAEEGISD